MEARWSKSVSASSVGSSSRILEGKLRSDSSIYDLRPAIERYDPARQLVLPVWNIYAIAYPDTKTNRKAVHRALYSGRIANLYNTITALGRAGEDEDVRLEESAAEDAKTALDIFVAHDVPPPSIFPNGSEVLVFKWESNDATRFAYLYDGVLTFKLYAPESKIPVTLNIELSSRDALTRMVSLLRSREVAPKGDI